MDMKARERVICACEEIGFEKYNIIITVPKEHPVGRKGLFGLDIDMSYMIINKNWQITFSRDTFSKALDDADIVTDYLDDMLESSKIVDKHDLLGALVTKVDRVGDDVWKITFRLKGGDVVEMFGDDEDNFIIYEA